MVSLGKRVDTAGWRGGPLDAAARWALAVIAASGVIVLAACGSTAAGGAGHPAATGPAAGASTSAGVPLCAAAQKVDRVVASLPSGQLRAALPRGITITDAPRVRALAAALCALPPTPRGLQCPANFGGEFRLVFAAGGQGFHPVRVQLSGCRDVTGMGPARTWSRSPGLERLLTRTVGGKGRMIPGMHPSSVPTP